MQTVVPHSEPTELLDPNLTWHERRDWLKAQFSERAHPVISSEEFEVHFAGMPAHYWERVTEDDLVWGLETIHGFLTLVTSPHACATKPFVSWRNTSHPHLYRVMLCTWDRRGLLAKAAAAFSAVQVNIQHAEVFTRADNIVLDEFFVAGSNGHSPVNHDRLYEMVCLLESALSEPPRFASVWARPCLETRTRRSLVPPQVTVDNESTNQCTLVHVAAADRLGLLYDLLQAITEAGLDIRQARIDTDENLACDTFHLTFNSQKITDSLRLESLRAKLIDAATGD